MQRKRSLVVVGMLGVALLLAWLVMNLGGSAGEIGPGDTGAAESLGTGRTPASLGTDAEPAEPTSAAVTRAALPAVEPAGPAVKFGSANGLELLVVDKVDQAPVAGARVHALGLARMSFGERKRLPLVEPDLEARLAASPEFVTDTDGRVWLPRGVRPGSACARKDAAYGSLSIQEGSTMPLRIELVTDRTLAIRAIDGNALPVAGVPVGLRRGGAPARQEDLWNGLTGADGIARLPHFDGWLSHLHAASGLVAHLAILARAGELGEVRIDPNTLPENPVDLIVPPCGSVEVRVHGPGGEVVTSGGMTLADAALLDEEGNLPWEAPAYEPALIEPGRAFFPFVGTGLELYVHEVGGGLGGGQARARGPARDGEQVTIELVVDELIATITARILAPDGDPLALRTVTAQAQGSMGSIGEPVTTDADGRLRAQVPERPMRKGRSQFLVITNDDEGERLEGWLALPETLALGDNDVGDVLLRRRAPLARVRVTDDLGRPVGGAALGVRDRSEDVDVARSGNPRVAIVPEGEGEFRLEGFLAGRALTCTATKSGFASAGAVEFTPPCGTVTITLPRASFIAGRARLDPEIGGGVVRVTLRYRERLPEELARLDGLRNSLLGDDGTFSIPDVRAGRVDLVFQRKDAKTPCFVLEDVLLLPGEHATDGRLEAIDLRGKANAPADAAPR